MRSLISTLLVLPDTVATGRLRFIESADYGPALARYARLRDERGDDLGPQVLDDALLALQQHYALIVFGVDGPVPTQGADELLEAHILADTLAFFHDFCPQAFGAEMHHVEGQDTSGDRIAATRVALTRYFRSVPGGYFARHRPHGNDIICWTPRAVAA